MKNKKKLPKIKQNMDVKKKAVVGVRQLKEYIYNKRANLTKEEVDVMINNLAVKVYKMAYETGWEDRNEIHKVRKSNCNARLIKAFDDFYNKRIGELPLKTMDEIRYMIDIALLTRYFNTNYNLDMQVNDRAL